MDTSKQLDPKDPTVIVISRVDYLFKPPRVNLATLTPLEALEVIDRTAEIYLQHFNQYSGVTPVADLLKKLRLIGTEDVDESWRVIPVFDPEERSWQSLTEQCYFCPDGSFAWIKKQENGKWLVRIANKDFFLELLKDDRFRCTFLNAFIRLSFRSAEKKRRDAAWLAAEDYELEGVFDKLI